MPRLWERTVDEHRASVRAAVLDAASTVIAEGGLTALSMSGVAERAGVGRATLYKYFPDTESILLAWHEAVVAQHLDAVREAAARPGSAWKRLDAALDAYAHGLAHRHAHGGHPADLHLSDHVSDARAELVTLLSGLITAAVAEGTARGDVPAAELAEFCLAAAAASPLVPRRMGTRRLVEVTLAALRPAVTMEAIPNDGHQSTARR